MFQFGPAIDNSINTPRPYNAATNNNDYGSGMDQEAMMESDMLHWWSTETTYRSERRLVQTR
jgi:hypothetical protein